MKHRYVISLVALSLTACGDDGDSKKTDAEFQAEVVAGIHDSIAIDLQTIIDGAKELKAAAPDHAWNNTTDADAISAMRAAWRKCRVGYEHVEGATAPLFGDLDVTMDARYDDYMEALGFDTGDQNLFDDQGVTGMHGIERILYSQEIRIEVKKHEMDLGTGYKAADYPRTQQEADDFKNKLVQKLIDDAQALHDQWQPAAIDLSLAFQGLIGLMNEQKEKVNLAATGEEESRYANVTLFDLRNNLDGTKAAYEIFRPWIKSKGGDAEDAMIQARFTGLSSLYASHSGNDLPAVPVNWSSDSPTPADLATPFGMIWKTVREDVDPTMDASVVSQMNKVAVLLGFPEFVEEE